MSIDANAEQMPIETVIGDRTLRLIVVFPRSDRNAGFEPRKGSAAR